MCDIDEPGARETAVMAPEGRCCPATVDVTVPDQVTRLIRDVRPQILVNDAGGGGHIPPHFPEARRGDWQRTVRVNCLVPDWVATERVSAAERATQPPRVPWRLLPPALCG